MTRELAWIIGFWIIIPVFPFFESDPWFRITIIIRDYFLLIRSCVFPLIISYKEQRNIEVITQEMITSCELIVQSELGLVHFEMFLRSIQNTEKNNDDCKMAGINALELFMQCENFICLPLDGDKERIYQMVKEFNISHYEDDSGLSIEYIREMLFLKLKLEYFPKFVNSKEYYKLKGEVTKQEIFIGRILQTSLKSNLYIAAIVKRSNNLQMISFTHN